MDRDGGGAVSAISDNGVLRAKDRHAVHDDFCVSVGLPVTVAQIGVTEPTGEMIRQVAEIAGAGSDTARKMPFEVNPDMIAGAIRAADAMGRAALTHCT